MSLKGVGRYLDENDDIIRVAVATDLAGDKGWTCASVEVDDNGRALDIEGKYIDINGKEPAMDKYFFICTATIKFMSLLKSAFVKRWSRVGPAAIISVPSSWH